MKKYNKQKIFVEINSNKIIKQNYSFLVLHPYPSIIVCCKNITINKDSWHSFGYDDYEQGKRHDEIDDDTFARNLSIGHFD